MTDEQAESLRDSRTVRGDLRTAVRGTGDDRPAPSVEVVPAGIGDVSGIHRIEASSFLNPGEVFNPRQIRYLIRRAIVLVAREHGGRVVGWAAGLVRRHKGGRSGRIYALAVDPSGRGLGVGRQLAEQVIRELGKQGAARIYLEARADNRAAIGLYRKLGFVGCRGLPDYYEPGVHGLRMVLEQ